MRKLDIMNTRDQVVPGEKCKWQMIGGKVTKVEEFIPKALVIEKEVKAEVKKIVEEAKEEIREEVKEKTIWERKKSAKKKKKRY